MGRSDLNFEKNHCCSEENELLVAGRPVRMWVPSLRLGEARHAVSMPTS